MISIVHQGDHRYDVYHSGHDIGCISVSTNPYHNRHCYLNLGLTQFDPAVAKELFSLLQKVVGKPLQVMCYSWKGYHDFLTAGGFVRRRRCYELEVSPSDLVAPLNPGLHLHAVTKGSPMYEACCELLYAWYCETHAPISPLTAPPDVFCTDLPQTLMCDITDGKPIHYAFVEPDESGFEIAYVGTTDLASFSNFAQALVSELFRKCSFLTAECDDTDPAAMTLKSLFHTPSDNSYDTYILPFKRSAV